ncbi:MAG: phosphate acyltransferase PlsX [Bacteroidia bacterium]|nr:phosphate acyltransferase PlsX [Bacteroidia bacterium]MCZ2248849.1 phosphate acyltransferase PlsX [Bacteroidia bacterium]
MKVGIDVMGGDFAPKNTIQGAILAQAILKNDADIVLIGDESIILDFLKKEGISTDLFEIVHASQNIEMHEHAVKALTHKPDSGIAIGFKLLAENKIQAFSSAGNTGAVFVGAIQSVKPIKGVLRPCITSVLPKENGSISLFLDVGTNADCKPEVLNQFGLLGSLYFSILTSNTKPRVALLNIGEEPEKGNLLTQSAYQLMVNNKEYDFIGNIEGRDLFNDKADVFVCDGFTGNIILKTAEAFYSLIKTRNRSDNFFDRFNYEIYGGTPILGVNGTVMIGHGISSPEAIKNMLIQSKQIAEARLHEKIKEKFNHEQQN